MNPHDCLVSEPNETTLPMAMGLDAPWMRAWCRVCGRAYVLGEDYGFVYWSPVEDYPTLHLDHPEREFAITFGSQWRDDNPHPVWPLAHADGYLVVIAPDSTIAHMVADRLFGNTWSRVRTVDMVGDSSLFPRGELGRIDAYRYGDGVAAIRAPGTPDDRPDPWPPEQSHTEHRREVTSLYLRRPLPEPGRIIALNEFREAGYEGIKTRYMVGEVLWTTSYRWVIRTSYTGGDPRHPRPDVVQHGSDHIVIALRDGREAHLDSSAPAGREWRYLDDDETDNQVAVLAEVDRLRAAADAMPGGRPNREAHNALIDAADRLYASTGIASPERLAVLTDGHSQPIGPRLPGFSELLDQDQIWVPAGRGPMLLAEMGPRHRRHLVPFLRRRAGRLREREMWTFIGAPDEVMDAAEREPLDEWFERQPLIRKLRELTAADEAAGTPDEPPPTEDDLARWRQHSDRAADGSEDTLPEEEIWRRRRAEQNEPTDLDEYPPTFSPSPSGNGS